METADTKRLDILNSLLTTSHRELSKISSVHTDVLNSDPLFYLRLAAWYEKNGTVRDNKEMFTANLVTHTDNDFREVGLALLREFAPYEVERIINQIHKTKKNIPTSVKTEVTRYIRERESNNRHFDTAVLHGRKSLKRLYALLHIKPSERAQAILFDNQPPTDSDAFLVKQLVKTTDPVEQAKLIMENKIPYRVASSVVKKMTPTVLLALIEVMSSAELINNMGALKKHGVFDNVDLKNVVEAKLKTAEGSKKISALKSMVAAKNAGLSDDLTDQLNAIADHQVKSGARITRPTALLIDKSQSMHASIEIGKQLGSLISAAMADGVNLYTYAFDTIVYPIKPKGPSLAEWGDALKYIKADGCTCCGAPMVSLKDNKEFVENIVMITDEGENRAPAFLKSYEDYCETLDVKPSVYMIRCGEFTDNISGKLERAGVELSKYDIRTGADYYSLPQIITYLAKPSRLELLMEVMSYPLPKRNLPKKLHKVEV